MLKNKIGIDNQLKKLAKVKKKIAIKMNEDCKKKQF